MPFDTGKIADPRFFAENRLPACAEYSFYRSGAEAKSGQSSFVFCLDGLWKFSCAKNPACAIPGFEAQDFCCRAWDDIRVPAHIQLEGYGVPQYVNRQYPWDGREQVDPGQIPLEENPVGSYVKYFTLPDAMQSDRRLFISFLGVESAFALWLNGNYVGYSEDSFTPAGFELTRLVKPGENKLAVQVYRFSSGSWLEDQDFYRFSGIFRSVILYSTPQVHLRDLRINATLDPECNKGRLSVLLSVAGSGGRVTAALSKDGKAVASLKAEARDGAVMECETPSPALWSAEEPNLYRLFIEVYNSAGLLQEVVTEQVAFRRFEMKDGLMCLNGRRIEFRGVNRHEFGAVNGRVMSAADTELDIITMKRHNINAVRTSHYPNNSFFYRLCDQYGLYVINEVNLETHGTWDNIADVNARISAAVPGDRPEWRDNVLDRANSLFQRDKNRPCVLLWSCGNESFGGRTIYEMSQFFRREDPCRLVHYEGVFNDRRYNATSDVESQMYTPASKVADWLREHRDKPFIMCEYAHAMGNSLGAIHKYTQLCERYPLYQGGFIWDYIDQGIAAHDRFGNGFIAYGGDFGDAPSDCDFCGNGIVYADRSPSPKMQEVKFVYQPVKLAVENNRVLADNRSLFTHTRTWQCRAVLKREGKTLADMEIDLNVPPLQKGEAALPFTLPEEAGEYTVTVSLHLREDTRWAPRGHEVAFGQGVFLVKCAREPDSRHDAPRLVCGRHNFGVSGPHFEALFSKEYGGLTSYRYGGVPLTAGVPTPNFWRAPTQNDTGNNMPGRYGQWLIASRYARTLPNAAKADQTQDGARVVYTYELPTCPSSVCSVTYLVKQDGAITVTMCCQPAEGLSEMPEFGLLMRMDAVYERIEWYGNGPAETYADRRQGAKLDVYSETVSDAVARYIIPQETGNKTGVRWAKITDAKGRGLLFSSPSPMEFSALPYTPFEMENAMHHTELPPVHYTVLRPALSRMGVGGDNSWGAETHPEYLLSAGQPLSFTFTFKGI